MKTNNKFLVGNKRIVAWFFVMMVLVGGVFGKHESNHAEYDWANSQVNSQVFSVHYNTCLSDSECNIADAFANNPTKAMKQFKNRAGAGTATTKEVSAALKADEVKFEEVVSALDGFKGGPKAIEEQILSNTEIFNEVRKKMDIKLLNENRNLKEALALRIGASGVKDFKVTGIVQDMEGNLESFTVGGIKIPIDDPERIFHNAVMTKDGITLSSGVKIKKSSETGADVEIKRVESYGSYYLKIIGGSVEIDRPSMLDDSGNLIIEGGSFKAGDGKSSPLSSGSTVTVSKNGKQVTAEFDGRFKFYDPKKVSDGHELLTNVKRNFVDNGGKFLIKSTDLYQGQDSYYSKRGKGPIYPEILGIEAKDRPSTIYHFDNPELIGGSGDDALGIPSMQNVLDDTDKATIVMAPVTADGKQPIYINLPKPSDSSEDYAAPVISSNFVNTVPHVRGRVDVFSGTFRGRVFSDSYVSDTPGEGIGEGQIFIYSEDGTTAWGIKEIRGEKRFGLVPRELMNEEGNKFGWTLSKKGMDAFVNVGGAVDVAAPAAPATPPAPKAEGGAQTAPTTAIPSEIASDPTIIEYQHEYFSDEISYKFDPDDKRWKWSKDRENWHSTEDPFASGRGFTPDEEDRALMEKLAEHRNYRGGVPVLAERLDQEVGLAQKLKIKRTPTLDVTSNGKVTTHTEREDFESRALESLPAFQPEPPLRKPERQSAATQKESDNYDPSSHIPGDQGDFVQLPLEFVDRQWFSEDSGLAAEHGDGGLEVREMTADGLVGKCPSGCTVKQLLQDHLGYRNIPDAVSQGVDLETGTEADKVQRLLDAVTEDKVRIYQHVPRGGVEPLPQITVEDVSDIVDGFFNFFSG